MVESLSVPSMVMPVLAVHVAVGNLFCRRSANFGNLKIEAQSLARHRMVAIQQDPVALDFHDRKGMGVTILAMDLQVTSHLDARRKLALGDGLDQAFITQTKGVLRLQLDRGLVAGQLPIERRLDLGKRVAIAAMQVDHRFTAFFERLAAGVRHFVAKGDGGVFVDFHGDGIG